MSFVVSIVAISCTAAIVSQYLTMRAKKNESSVDAADAAQYAAQINALEERIRVLERIVTANKFDLRQEIDKL